MIFCYSNLNCLRHGKMFHFIHQLKKKNNWGNNTRFAFRKPTLLSSKTEICERQEHCLEDKGSKGIYR